MSATFRSLADPPVSAALARLHADAGKDIGIYLKALPSVAFGFLRGRSSFESAKPYFSDAYIPVSQSAGRFLYLLAASAKARNIVEFGSSFGISSIYLAAAARESGGHFTGTELEAHKAAIARQNLADAGLARWADIRDGDALESLAAFDGPVDFLFLDGWKDLYLPVLKLMEPRLAPGALITGDNLRNFRKTLKPFADYLADPANGYDYTYLPLESGMALARWTGRR